MEQLTVLFLEILILYLERTLGYDKLQCQVDRSSSRFDKVTAF